MEHFDDYLLVMAIGIPIVLVAATGIFVALTEDRPLRGPARVASPDAPEDDAAPATAEGPNR
jgi:hypothetical protein